MALGRSSIVVDRGIRDLELVTDGRRDLTGSDPFHQ